MNLLNFLQHLFTHRAIERELAEAKAKITILESENKDLSFKVQQRDDKIKILEDQLRSKPEPIVESHFNPGDF